MKVKVRYFGMIAEKTGCSEEIMEIEFVGKINFREFFEQKYPSLLNQVYRIAINQAIDDFGDTSNEINEIALLPPFAGG